MASARKRIHTYIKEAADSRTLKNEGIERSMLEANRPKLIKNIFTQIPGELNLIPTPYGERPQISLNTTFWSKSLNFVEEYIRNVIMPEYANTHTLTSWAGRQATYFRHEAREIIHRSVNGSELDVVIFTGSDSCSAIHKLIKVLKASAWGQRMNWFYRDRWGSYDCRLCDVKFKQQGLYLAHERTDAHKERVAEAVGDITDEVPVVFVSKMNDYQTFQAWEQENVELVVIEGVDGFDYDALEQRLEEFRERKCKIGCFPACSDITGVLLDTDRIAQILKDNGCLALFDFSSVSASIPIDMNKQADRCYDAVFITGQSYIGGASTPGILICKKWLISNEVPVVPAGGTVYNVTIRDQIYAPDPEDREEGGTPDVIGSIRAGVAFYLLENITPQEIKKRESEISTRFLEGISSENIKILGQVSAERVSIFSFTISYSNAYLHQNFIRALLADLFGITVNAYTIYSHSPLHSFELLQINPDLQARYQQAALEGKYVLIPGFIQLKLPFYINEEVLNYITTAIQFIARDAIWFLPFYQFDSRTGEFKHREHEMKIDPYTKYLHLTDVQYIEGQISYPQYTGKQVENLSQYLTKAQQILEDVKLYRIAGTTLEAFGMHIESELKWFIDPSDALDFTKNSTNITLQSPFTVPSHSSLISCPPAPLPDSLQKAITSPEIPQKLLNKIERAIQKFQMIQQNDKILVAVSGGKDSLSLVNILFELSKTSPLNFSIGAATVDPQVAEYNPAPLKDYFARRGIPYYYKEFAIAELAACKMTKPSMCAFCSRMRRGILYTCAREEGYNTLAMGQHLDDLVESFVMSIFNNGLLRTQKAAYVIKAGDLKVIRPLVYVREWRLREFAERSGLPIISENCPACFASPHERHRTKMFLAQQEQSNPDLFKTVKRAIEPLLLGNVSDMLKSSQQLNWIFNFAQIFSSRTIFFRNGSVSLHFINSLTRVYSPFYIRDYSIQHISEMQKQAHYY